jgi:hypothetical protein
LRGSGGVKLKTTNDLLIVFVSIFESLKEKISTLNQKQRIFVSPFAGS